MSASELQAIDRRTRNFFNIYGALYPKSDVDRFYIPRKEGGRDLISTEGCLELAMRGLEVYVHGSEERFIQAARGDKIDGLEAASVLKRSKNEKRLEDWEEKLRYGQYLRQIKEVRNDQCWGLASEWRFEKGDRKFYSGSSESEYKNKSS